MSDAPVYWSQPNQQVVRDGDPVGVIDDGPDPQAKPAKAKPAPEPTKAKTPVVDDEAPKAKSSE